MISLRPEIALHERRCYDCGKWWSCESETRGKCPMCAQGRIDNVLTEQARLERSNSALRGALTRKAKR